MRATKISVLLFKDSMCLKAALNIYIYATTSETSLTKNALFLLNLSVNQKPQISKLWGKVGVVFGKTLIIKI